MKIIKIIITTVIMKIIFLNVFSTSQPLFHQNHKLPNGRVQYEDGVDSFDPQLLVHGLAAEVGGKDGII